MLKEKRESHREVLPIGICFGLLGLCFVVYFFNGPFAYGSGGDNLPNTLLLFNFFHNHTVNLDALRHTQWYVSPDFSDSNNYALVESDNGHLTSAYPIGTALLTAPLYAVYYLFLQIQFSISGIELNIFSTDFEAYRIFFEKITSVFLTSTSVSLFFLILSSRFSTAPAIITSVIFAFGTNTWAVSSQALWQHTASNFSLLLCIFLFIQGERYEKNRDKYFLMSGFFCGLLPVIRPSNLLFFIALILFSLMSLRRKSVLFCLGSLSILVAVVWNLHYFNNLLSGGYGFLYGKDMLYEFSIYTFFTNIIHLCLSPSRGLFVYSPVLILALPGLLQLWKYRSGRFEKLFIHLAIAAFGIFSSFCFYRIWWGGYSFGPRLLIDLLPVLCVLVCYSLESFLATSASSKIFYNCLLLGLFSSSIFVQFVGVLGGQQGGNWNGIPLSIDYCSGRAMQWDDQQIGRYRNAVWNSLVPSITSQSEYARNLSGRVTSFELRNECIAEDFYSSLSPRSAYKLTNSKNPLKISAFAEDNIIFKAGLLNTGKSRWYGYKAALSSGEARVKVAARNAEGLLNDLGWLYIESSPKRNEKSNAIGAIRMPEVPGDYNLEFKLFSDSEQAFTSSPTLAVPLHISLKPWINDSFSKFKSFDHEIRLIGGNLNSFLPGEEREIELWIKNKSNFGWSRREPYPVRLSYRWFYPNGQLAIAPEIRGRLPFYLNIGRNAAVKLNLVAPTKPGTYRLVFSAIQEDVAWFTDHGAAPLAFEIVVSESS